MWKPVWQNAVVAVLSAAGYLYTYTFKLPSNYEVAESVSAAAWPRILLGSMFVLACWLTIQEAIKAASETKGDRAAIERDSKGDSSTEAGRKKDAFRKLYMVIGALGGYAVLTPIVGFLPSTFLVQVAVLWILSPKKGRSLLGVPITVTVIIYVLFLRVLGMTLPRGIGPFMSISRLLY